MMDDPLIGRQLGNYRIEHLLGRGGMAVVYYATDARLRRPAAIKIIDARFRGDKTYAERFIQEARSVASLHHEHILQIYTAGDEDGLYYFAMEYIDGQTLADILAVQAAEEVNLPYEDVLRYGRAIAGALDAAHVRGVIHRDVKPSNVLVSRDGRIVLGDFGLALDVQQGSFGEAFGTAHYVAPEQARRSNAAVPQSDLYSLGIILYEMLTGSVPFDDPSPTSIALQHLTQPVPLPREKRPELSEGVEAVLLRALSKKPEDRYPTGQALMLNLEDALIRQSPSLPTVRSTVDRPRGLPSESPVQTPEADHPAQALRPSQPAQVDFAGRTPLPTLPGWDIQPTGPQTTPPSPTTTKTGTTSPFFTRKNLPLIAGAAGLVVILVGLMLVVSMLLKKPPITDVQSSSTPPVGQAIPVAETAPAVTQPVASVPIDPAVPTLTSAPGVLPPTAAPAAASPAANPTPSWTPRYAAGRRMLLYWNDSSFYMLQTSGYGELIDPLVFERLDAQGAASNRFTGKLWAEFSPSSLRDWCFRLLVGGPDSPPNGLAYLEPQQCQNQYMATRFPTTGDPTLFWTQQTGSTAFRVLWGRDELQRCDISAGVCEVYLP